LLVPALPTLPLPSRPRSPQKGQAPGGAARGRLLPPGLWLRGVPPLRPQPQARPVSGRPPLPSPAGGNNACALPARRRPRCSVRAPQKGPRRGRGLVTGCLSHLVCRPERGRALRSGHPHSTAALRRDRYAPAHGRAPAHAFSRLQKLLVPRELHASLSSPATPSSWASSRLRASRLRRWASRSAPWRPLPRWERAGPANAGGAMPSLCDLRSRSSPRLTPRPRPLSGCSGHRAGGHPHPHRVRRAVR
jgi:hypothetical protein